jgi:very-short-patch-repair endonuclease
VDEYEQISVERVEEYGRSKWIVAVGYDVQRGWNKEIVGRTRASTKDSPI